MMFYWGLLCRSQSNLSARKLYKPKNIKFWEKIAMSNCLQMIFTVCTRYWCKLSGGGIKDIAAARVARTGALVKIVVIL